MKISRPFILRFIIVVLIFMTCFVLMERSLKTKTVQQPTIFRVVDSNDTVRIKSVLRYGDHGELSYHYDQSGQLITGACFNYHSLTKVRRVGMCRDGKFEGQVLGYEKTSNRLVFEGYYKDGLRHGHFKVYNNGKLKRFHNLKRGKLHGRQRDYYTNGNVHCDGFYRNHIRIGEVKCYYEDGLLEEIGDFRNGLREGTHWRWKRDGSRQWEMDFKKGWEAKHNETYLVKSVISGDTILLANDQRVRLKGIEGLDKNLLLDGQTSRQFLKSILKKGNNYVHVRLEFSEPRTTEKDWEAYVFVDTGYTRDTLPNLKKWRGPKDYYIDYFPIRMNIFINATMIKKGYARAANHTEGSKYYDVFKDLEGP